MTTVTSEPRSHNAGTALQERADLTKRKGFLEGVLEDPLTKGSFLARTNAEKQLLEVTTRLAAVQQGLNDAYAGSISTMETVTTKARDMDAVAKRMASDRARDLAEEEQLQKQVGALKLDMILKELDMVSKLHAEILTNATSFTMPHIGLDDGLTKEQIKSRDALIGNADKNAQLMTNAIAQSAQIVAQAISQALNIGGGGKGSNIGGAIGGTAGFAGGFAIGGPIGGAIGSAIGNIAGSLFGGLFDSNKKSVNSNTLATERNTAMMGLLLHAPSGYRVDRHGYGNAAALYEAVAEEAMRRRGRGGVQVLGMAT